MGGRKGGEDGDGMVVREEDMAVVTHQKSLCVPPTPGVMWRSCVKQLTGSLSEFRNAIGGGGSCFWWCF